MPSSRASRGCKSTTDEWSDLQLTFPWGETLVLVSPTDLSSRQFKYLQWCLKREEPSSSRPYRLLGLLGFLTYGQVRWAIKQKLEWVKEKQRWR